MKAWSVWACCMAAMFVWALAGCATDKTSATGEKSATAQKSAVSDSESDAPAKEPVASEKKKSSRSKPSVKAAQRRANRIDALLMAGDKDLDGKLTMEEWRKAVPLGKPVNFFKLDRNGDKVISRADY